MIETITTIYFFLIKTLSKEYFIITSFFNSESELKALISFLYSYASVIGISLTLSYYLKIKNIFLSTFITLNLGCLLLFLFLFTGYFFSLIFIIKFTGFLLFLFFIIRYFLNFKPIKFCIFSKEFWLLKAFLFSLPVYFFIVQSDAGFVGFDTFFHGMFSKSIHMNGEFWDKDSLISKSHIRTLPFFYLLQNYFLYPGIFHESTAVAASNVLWMSSIGAVILHLRNFSKSLPLYIIIIFLVSIVGLHGPFFTLTSEGYIAASLGAFLYLLSLNLSITLRFLLLICASSSILMKELVLIILPQIFIISIAKSTFDFNTFKFYSCDFKKILFIHLIPLFIGVMLYFTFNYQFSEVENGRSSIAGNGALEDVIDRISRLVPIFVDGVLNRNIYTQGVGNRYFYLFSSSGFIFSFGGLYVILSFGIISLISNIRERLFILIFFNIGYFSNLIFLFIIFIFGMSESEGIQLASFERYGSVFVFTNILFVICKIFENPHTIWKSNKIKYLYVTNIQTLFVTMLYFFSINGFFHSGSVFISSPENAHVVKIKKSSYDFINYFKYSDLIKKDDRSLVFTSGNSPLRNIQIGYLLAPNFHWPVFGDFNWSNARKAIVFKETDPKHIFIVGDILDNTGSMLNEKIETEIQTLSKLGYKKHTYINNFIHLIKPNGSDILFNSLD